MWVYILCKRLKCWILVFWTVKHGEEFDWSLIFGWHKKNINSHGYLLSLSLSELVFAFACWLMDAISPFLMPIPTKAGLSFSSELWVPGHKVSTREFVGRLSQIFLVRFLALLEESSSSLPKWQMVSWLIWQEMAAALTALPAVVTSVSSWSLVWPTFL